MNIDGATAVSYAELGFAPPLARGLFVLSRTVGILAHAWRRASKAAATRAPSPNNPPHPPAPVRRARRRPRLPHRFLTHPDWGRHHRLLDGGRTFGP